MICKVSLSMLRFRFLVGISLFLWSLQQIANLVRWSQWISGHLILRRKKHTFMEHVILIFSSHSKRRWTLDTNPCQLEIRWAFWETARPFDRKKVPNFLVGGWTNPFLKNMLVKLDHFPKFRGENQKCLSCHHLVSDYITSFHSRCRWVSKQISFVRDVLHQSRICPVRMFTWRVVFELFLVDSIVTLGFHHHKNNGWPNLDD